MVTAGGSSHSGSRCRARIDLPSLAIVPCDNVPDNGPMAARWSGELGAAVNPGLTIIAQSLRVADHLVREVLSSRDAVPTGGHP